jgi:hypothetical protein
MRPSIWGCEGPPWVESVVTTHCVYGKWRGVVQFSVKHLFRICISQCEADLLLIEVETSGFPLFFSLVGTHTGATLSGRHSRRRRVET